MYDYFARAIIYALVGSVLAGIAFVAFGIVGNIYVATIDAAGDATKAAIVLQVVVIAGSIAAAIVNVWREHH